MLAAVDCCFDLLRSRQHGIANTQAQGPVQSRGFISVYLKLDLVDPAFINLNIFIIFDSVNSCGIYYCK